MQSSPRIDELRQKFHENPRRYFAPLANEYRKAGDPEQAIAICRAHLAQQPGHMSGHVVYGQALYDARRTDEARAAFQQALTLDPENVIVLRYLGDIARQAGRTEEARSWYSRALDVDPHDAEIAAYLAELAEPLIAGPVETEVAVNVATAADVEPSAEGEHASASESAPASPLELMDLDVVEVPPLHTEEGAAGEAALSDLYTPDITAIESPTPYADEPAVSAAKATPEAEDSPYLDEAAPDRELAEEPAGPPIVTRTMAELYLEQGHIEPALEIYRQLAAREPEDSEIRARVEELSGGDTVEETPPLEEVTATVDDAGSPPSRGFESESLLETLPEAFDATASEPAREKEPPSEAGLMEEAAGAGEMGAPVSEPAEEQPSVVPPVEAHFTETDLAAELWGTADSWGAEFFADTAEDDELFGLPATEDDRQADTAATTEDVEWETEPVAPSTPEATTTVGAESEPETVAEETEADTAATSEGFRVDGREEMEPVEEARPQARFQEITVREFFATLGAMRPPMREDRGWAESTMRRQPATTYAESPYEPVAEAPAETQSPGEQHYPLADDAFSNLFADSLISEEDSRAAAALSGAVAHPAPAVETVEPAGAAPSRATERVGGEEPAKESEEDIRRFREWLDGLAES